ETKSNNKKVQNIITQNIYGNHSNSNIGVGENIQLTIIPSPQIGDLIQDLHDLGVPKEDTDKMREIVSDSKDKDIAKKIFEWVGNLSTKAIEKGVELQIPTII